MRSARLFDRASSQLKSAWYQTRQGRPFTTGYGAYKEEQIRRALGRQELHERPLPPGYGKALDERIVEYPWLFAELPAGPGTLLDAGSALNFRFLLDHPALAEKVIYICTLAPERQSFWQLGISYTYQDLRQTCFRDGFFDYVACLSTLEHIGLDNSRYANGVSAERKPDSYLAAMRELARVLRPGGRLYLTIPFGTHADLGWLQVFDAVMVDRAAHAFAPSQVVERIFRYSVEGWRESDRHDSANSTYVDLHRAVSWTAGTPVAAESVACLTLTK